MKWKLWVCIFIEIVAVADVNVEEFSRYEDTLIAEDTGMIQLQFPYNINTDYLTTSTTGSGTVTQSNNLAQIASGAAASSSATLQSKARLNHQSGQGCVCIFGGRFTTGVANNTQIAGIGNAQDGLFFGYNGMSFGILYRRNSVNTWTAQSSWNEDSLDGTGSSGITLNPQNGNVYKIQYKGVGFGSVHFYVENPTDGSWILVHTIQYPNVNTNTLFLNSSLRLYVSSANTTNTSNRTVFVSSMGAALEGKYDMNLQRRANAANTAGKALTTTFANVLTIRNNSTYTSKNNQVIIQPDMISFLQPATQNPTEFALFLNATLGGSPSFTQVSATSSVVSFDTAGTTVSGGKQLGSFYLANDRLAALIPSGLFSTGAPELIYNERYVYNLKKFNIVLFPGDQLVVAARTSAGTGTGYAALSWQEKF